MYKYIDYFETLSYNNLTDKAYDILEEMIVTLELTPSKTYSENELSNLIGIGRTPVREAIKRLEDTHTIEIIPRHGIQITPVRLEECLLQLEVRCMLEKLVAVRAAKFSTNEEKSMFKSLAKRYQKASDDLDALTSIRIDNEFNNLSANSCKNVFAKTALTPLQPMPRRIYFMQYYQDEQRIKSINQYHILVMQAISNGDENATLHNLELLLDDVRKMAISSLDSLTISTDFYNGSKGNP